MATTIKETMTEVKGQRLRRKPSFIRQDFHKKRLAKKWRKPKGIHSKVRMKKRGFPPSVSIGFGTGKKGTVTPDGLTVRAIHAPGGLSGMDRTRNAIMLSRTVGKKKRLAILKTAVAQGIHVTGTDAASAIKSIEEFIAAKKERKKKLAEKKKEEPKAETETPLEAKLGEEVKTGNGAKTKGDQKIKHGDEQGGVEKVGGEDEKVSGEDEKVSGEEKRNKEIREAEKVLTRRDVQ